MPLTIAYLSQNNIRLKEGERPPATIESVYGNSIREKAVSRQQRNSWKSRPNEGGGLISGPSLWGNSAIPTTVPISLTSLCAGHQPGEYIYSLDSGTLCALLLVQDKGAEEKRIWNDNNSCVRHLHCSRSGDLAFSIIHDNGTANIGIKINGEGGIKELTEGDSVDTAPRWIPGEERRIVFQSAGVGRNREGHYLKLGPFCIQELNMDTGEMRTLLEDSKVDYLSPHMTQDGALYYVRRPYQAHAKVSFFGVFKDVLLFPFRLLHAVFHYLNFFSMIYSGKKLSTSGGAKSREIDQKQMMIWGNLINAQQAGAQNEEGIELIPSTWELVKRCGNKEQVLAKSIAAFDVADDGTVVFSTGNALYSLTPQLHKQKLLSESMIEQVAVLRS